MKVYTHVNDYHENHTINPVFTVPNRNDFYVGDDCKNNDNSAVKKNKEEPLKLYGWICPFCGRGNAPFSSCCPCAGPPGGYVVTC